MQHSIVRTAEAPAAIGAYSQATTVWIGHKKMIFCSGQVALDLATGAMIEGDVADQTRRVLDHLGAVLAAAGARFADVVKTTVFLASMEDAAKVNAVYSERFPHDPPARAMVQAARLPRDAKVEIDAIAIL